MKTTRPAPADQQDPRSREQADAARFGTIGFDLYRALVLATEAAFYEGLNRRRQEAA